MAQLVKTLGGLAIASVKSVGGLAVASVKAIGGVDNTAGSWEPTTPSNTLKQWNKADALAGADSSAVEPWTASAGVDLASGADDSPILRTAGNGKNGKNIVVFDGASQALRGTFVGSQAQPATIHLCFKQTSGSYMLDGDADNASRWVLNTNIAWQFYAGANALMVSVPDIDTVWHILRIEVTGASSTYFFDGGSEFTFLSSPGTDSLTGVTLGGAYVGTGVYGAVSIAEYFLHNGLLSSGDKASAYAYLYNKYHDGADSWVAPP